MWHLFFLFAFLFWVCALRAVQSFFTMSCKLFLSCCVEKRTFLRRGKPTTLRFDALEVEEEEEEESFVARRLSFCCFAHQKHNKVNFGLF